MGGTQQCGEVGWGPEAMGATSCSKPQGADVTQYKAPLTDLQLFI